MLTMVFFNLRNSIFDLEAIREELGFVKWGFVAITLVDARYRL
jgi:hypothetical protein